MWGGTISWSKRCCFFNFLLRWRWRRCMTTRLFLCSGTRLSTKRTIRSGAEGVYEHWNSRNSLDGGDTMIFDATVAALSRQSPAIVNTIGRIENLCTRIGDNTTTAAIGGQMQRFHLGGDRGGKGMWVGVIILSRARENNIGGGKKLPLTYY